MSNADLNACIVGAGPAGSALAISLARRGHSVLLVERSPQPWRKTGESLVPAARRIFASLSLSADALLHSHLRSPGTLSSWGGQIEERDAIRDVDGEGWHLDRTQFEQTLMAVAEQHGVRILRNTSASVDPRNNHPWLVNLRNRTSDVVSRVTATVLVDATGRSASVARALGAARLREDLQVAICALLQTSATAESRTIVERSTHDEQWWYGAAVRPGQVSAALHRASVDETTRSLLNEHRFASEYQLTSLLRRQLGSVVCVLEGPRIERASGEMTLPPCGERWLAVGDAALAFDPLASQGIYHALYASVGASDCIDAMLRNDPNSQYRYTAKVTMIAESYRRQRELLRASAGLPVPRGPDKRSSIPR